LCRCAVPYVRCRRWTTTCTLPRCAGAA
jgi:hypothetical protein